MPEYLTVTGASRRFLISEKSIRQWIKSGVLLAGRVMMNGKMQYSIDAAHMEEVMKSRNMTVIPKPDTKAQDLQDEINRLSRAMEALSKRVSQLEQERYNTTEYRIPEPTAPAPRRRSRTSDVIDFQAFADLHGLDVERVKRAAGKTAKGVNEDTHKTIWQRYHATVITFQRCDSCPLEEN